MALGVAVLASLLVAPAAPVGAVEDPATAVAPAMERLQATIDAVVGAEQARDAAAGELADADQALAAATDAFRTATDALTEQRRLYGELSAASYVRHGVASPRDHQVMVGALSARRHQLELTIDGRDEAEDVLDDAMAAQAEASAAFGEAEATREGAEADRVSAEEAADATLAAVGATDLPGVAYLAYQRAAADINAIDPECRLPAAVLAGIGRVRWRHGRPTGPTAELVETAPGPDEPAGAYDLPRVLTPLAEALCAGDAPLDAHVPLQAAVYGEERDSARVRIVLAAARRYARTPGVDLGLVPSDPYATSDGVPQFDTYGVALEPGDVPGMLDWAASRLGTPYSQCLGPDARPQDPLCPPGTNRFGNGFFDCSGFTHTAYRLIGLTIPATTYAMEADPAFMATQVATRFDTALMEPGDIFLMDGHTGMYVGDGHIIHAAGGGLTMEPVPRWVAHATFAVLRPIDLMGNA
ncbi:C40 family peptidase [Rhabdothermincola salaria]|uniref:C40 family peptidase n=1 Tax=Rhabdothermincola salaria TaxID=2903142 RepID=UPI001E46BAC7|nr:NlpC/P60 family protein [Rhabdothermincola salaria]MCD9622971.1 C40 family peptidase [Rhabdothermincola salaria]